MQDITVWTWLHTRWQHPDVAYKASVSFYKKSPQKVIEFIAAFGTVCRTAFGSVSLPMRQRGGVVRQCKSTFSHPGKITCARGDSAGFRGEVLTYYPAMPSGGAPTFDIAYIA